MRRFRPEQKSYFLVWELESRVSQPGDLVVDTFAGTFSATVACSKVCRHRMLVRCESDRDCFGMPKKALLKPRAENALEAGTYSSLSGKGTETGEVMLGLIVDEVAASPLWSLLDGLPLYCWTSPGVPTCLLSLWQDAELDGTRSMRPALCCSEP